MQAEDIMSSPVISVAPHTPVLQVAALLREQRIGGVPVLLGHELVGIVTEKDLLHRHEIGTETRRDARPWWRHFLRPTLGPQRYIKSYGRCARHVMTPDVISVTRHTPLAAITQLFERHRIGRVPVLDGHRVVGVVTAADMVKAIAAGRWIAPAAAAPDDAQIRAALLQELRSQPWWNDGISAVEVDSGVVRFTGYFESVPQQQASVVAAENLAGARFVLDQRQQIEELPTML